jgi:hypothetical protein
MKWELNAKEKKGKGKEINVGKHRREETEIIERNIELEEGIG